MVFLVVCWYSRLGLTSRISIECSFETDSSDVENSLRWAFFDASIIRNYLKSGFETNVKTLKVELRF